MTTGASAGVVAVELAWLGHLVEQSKIALMVQFEP